MLRISESNKYPIELIGAWKTMVGPVKDQTSEQTKKKKEIIYSKVLFQLIFGSTMATMPSPRYRSC